MPEKYIPDFEPAIMMWHRGKLQIALDISRQMKDLYKNTKVGDFMDDVFHLINVCDTELGKMTEEKNQKMFEEATNKIRGGD